MIKSKRVGVVPIHDTTPQVLVAQAMVPNSFAFTSPYGGCWLEKFYRNGARNLFEQKVKTEIHFRKLLESARCLPEIMILGNFIVERFAIQSLCCEFGINWVCSEDGFFPHYETLHADPLGFAWESSLSRMVFRGITDRQRQAAAAKRTSWLQFQPEDLPPGVHSPFVLWPLQLIGDKVNKWDLNVSDWSDIIAHFRQSLPLEYQLVIKTHPRSKNQDLPKQPIVNLPNTVVIQHHWNLRSLIQKSSAVAGANSTVLMEARLMFHKPTYAYARSWFTNHAELVTPIALQVPSRDLNRKDYIDDNRLLRTERLDDYTDWFLYQLLSRQLSHEGASNWDELRQWIMTRTYRAYIENGESIFDPAPFKT